MRSKNRRKNLNDTRKSSNRGKELRLLTRKGGEIASESKAIEKEKRITIMNIITIMTSTESIARGTLMLQMSTRSLATTQLTHR